MSSSGSAAFVSAGRVIGFGCSLAGVISECFKSSDSVSLVSEMVMFTFVSIFIGDFVAEDSMVLSAVIALAGGNKGVSSQHVSRMKSYRSFVLSGSKCI